MVGRTKDDRTNSVGTALLEPPEPNRAELPNSAETPHTQRAQGKAFADSLAAVLREEGRRVVVDRHGISNSGINSGAHPDKDVRALTHKQIEHIYRDHYWKPLHCDEMPRAMQLVAFDASVNMGQGRAGLVLLKAAGMLDENERISGRITKRQQHLLAEKLPELLEKMKSMSEAEINQLAINTLDMRRGLYREFAHDPAQHKYLAGWLRRVDRIEHLALAGTSRTEHLAQLALQTPEEHPQLTPRQVPQPKPASLVAKLETVPEVLPASPENSRKGLLSITISFLGFRGQDPRDLNPTPDFRRLTDEDDARAHLISALTSTSAAKAEHETAVQAQPAPVAEQRSARKHRASVPMLDDPYTESEN